MTRLLLAAITATMLGFVSFSVITIRKHLGIEGFQVASDILKKPLVSVVTLWSFDVQNKIKLTGKT